MKRKFARISLAAIFGLAILGFADISKAADAFKTDDFSGMITFSSPMTMPSGTKILTLNYSGVVTFDETKVAALSPGFQTYPTFISDGGSVSLSLDFSFGTLTLNTPTSPSPTLVVDLNKPVGFDFTLASGGTVPVTFVISAPSATPAPGTGTTTWTGVNNNVTLTVKVPIIGNETVSGTTVPTFKATSVPEPGNLALACVGALALIAALPQIRRRMAVAV